MTIDQFKQTPGLVDWVREVQADPNWQFVLNTLEDSHPRKSDRGNPDHAYRNGVTDGFDMAVEMLRSMGIPEIQMTMPEATFGVKDLTVKE